MTNTEKSLDPRVNRLELSHKDNVEKVPLDQLETYEVFIQTKEGRPLEHEGIVHAYDEEMAFVFAKEQFSRRATCVGMFVVRTDNVIVSELYDDGRNVYDSIQDPSETGASKSSYEVFHLFKRGKQHVHAGSVQATSSDEAFYEAKMNLDPGNPAKPVLNIWLVKTDDIYASDEEDVELWLTTPEKTFREALDYKGADKIKKYKESKK
jgi:ring-1,2-phenylacetyl-CoA epoxidase subunit PaaB